MLFLGSLGAGGLGVFRTGEGLGCGGAVMPSGLFWLAWGSPLSRCVMLFWGLGLCLFILLLGFL